MLSNQAQRFAVIDLGSNTARLIVLSTLHGFSLNRSSIAKTVQQLRELPLAERRKISGLNSDRADIILPGAVVIHTIMERLQKEALIISINGLREGLFFEQFWQHLSYPVVDNIRRS